MKEKKKKKKIKFTSQLLLPSFIILHSVMEVNMHKDSESHRHRLLRANEYSNGGENMSALIINIPRHAIITGDKQSRGF